MPKICSNRCGNIVPSLRYTISMNLWWEYCSWSSRCTASREQYYWSTARFYRDTTRNKTGEFIPFFYLHNLQDTQARSSFIQKMAQNIEPFLTKPFSSIILDLLYFYTTQKYCQRYMLKKCVVSMIRLLCKSPIQHYV